MQMHAGSDRTSRASWTPVLLLAGAGFVLAAVQGGAAAASPNNCGELPGIARFGAMVVGGGIAIGILVIGGLAAAVTKRAWLFGAAAVIGLAIVAGVVIGIGLAQPYPCG